MKTLIGLMVSAAATLSLAGAAPAAEVEGSYVVPASEDMPTPVEVGLHRADLRRRSNGAYRLDYRLPAELDGAEGQRFRVEGRRYGNTVNMSGTQIVEPALPGEPTVEPISVVATCTVVGEEASCRMEYGPGFTINHAAADEYLANNVPDVVRADELRTARGVLEHQAVGIVKILRWRR